MKLSYGQGNTCELARLDVVAVAGEAASCVPAAQIADRVREALSNPLDYPDLATATVPGDRVVAAIEYGVPLVTHIISGGLESLEHAGIEKSDTTVLLSPDFASNPQQVELIRESVDQDVNVLVHSVDDEERLSFLGVTAAERPLRLNRALCDADVVIPIGLTKSVSRSEVVSSFFQDFSDPETVRRFRSPASHESADSRQQLAEEINECHWMLGVNLCLQVVPGPDGCVANVICGTPSSALKAAQSAYQHVWSADVKERADLVVATITGDREQQTWQSISRALAVANELVHPGGAIALCTELSNRPGPSGKRLRHAKDLEELERKLLKDEFADTISILALCRSLLRGTVYLKSQLDSGLVESMGLAPIESNEDLERLTRRFHRCLVLEEAQYLEPRLAPSN